MKAFQLMAVAMAILFLGCTPLMYGQQVQKHNLTADQQKVQYLQQQTLAEQNKTREVEVVSGVPGFPKLYERHNMAQAWQEYDLAKKAWVEENDELYRKIIQESNNSLTPNN